MNACLMPPACAGSGKSEEWRVERREEVGPSQDECERALTPLGGGAARSCSGVRPAHGTVRLPGKDEGCSVSGVTVRRGGERGGLGGSDGWDRICVGRDGRGCFREETR